MSPLAPYPQIEQYDGWQSYVQSEIQAIPDLYQLPCFRPLQPAFHSTSIRSLLIVPLLYRQHILGYLTLFRDTIETETLWAGRIDPDQRQSYPRLSFDLWRETQKNQIQPWTVDELDLAKTLGLHFATAIQQYETHQQLQSLNASLEDKVKARTLELQAATRQQQDLLAQQQQQAEQQSILYEVVAKMRRSLQLDTIFTTVTQEVRRILKADRVGVYRFDPNSDFNFGEFVAEDVLPQFSSALAAKIHDHCFGETYANHYRLGRIYVRDDIDTEGLQDCFKATLDQFQIQATLVTPLMKGDDLWGLFCIHQCDQPRHWQGSEIQFASQIAAQLGVALEQADLLNQTLQQAQQLAETLRELQQTQTQLIQTEKMSSLGQLVAGVAHEINNPVNFIHGNLVHAASYMQDLLKMLSLYQQHYPSPHPDIQVLAEALDIEFLADDLPKTLSSMRVGTERIRQIVLSLRNFSRLDQSEMKVVDIHEGLDSTLLILQHRLKSTAHRPEIQLIKSYNELPEIGCYSGQLNQVFMNILTNAIDVLDEVAETQRNAPDHAGDEWKVASLRTPTITIRTEVLSGQRVAIHIGDNGKGMTEAVRHSLFDPFFTTKPVGKGTGLGMSISYQIVTQTHQGQLLCQSTPGEGTEFTIELPI